MNFNMPFEVTILQDNKVLPVNVVAMLEQRGFQQEQDADAFYISKTYGSSTDAIKEVLELAPNIQLDRQETEIARPFALLRLPTVARVMPRLCLS